MCLHGRTPPWCLIIPARRSWMKRWRDGCGRVTRLTFRASRQINVIAAAAGVLFVGNLLLFFTPQEVSCLHDAAAALAKLLVLSRQFFRQQWILSLSVWKDQNDYTAPQGVLGATSLYYSISFQENHRRQKAKLRGAVVFVITNEDIGNNFDETLMSQPFCTSSVQSLMEVLLIKHWC